MVTKLEPGVWLKESQFLLRNVNTAEEALLLLDQFQGERGALYFHARLMLNGAIDRTVSQDDARQAFWAFAEDNRLLGESAAA